MQNWQSEFLTVGSMAILAVSSGSADRRVEAGREPHESTGATA
jgi:hypothetical protein